MKDWIGNKRSIFSTLGASNHSDYEREERDFYATDPIAIDGLYNILGANHFNFVWEPACGNGHLSKRIKELFPQITVYNSDIIERDFPVRDI